MTKRIDVFLTMINVCEITSTTKLSVEKGLTGRIIRNRI